MGDGQMIALHEILAQKLPVRIPEVILGHNRDVARHVVGSDDALQRLENRGDAFSLRIERHVNPALPDFRANLWQMMLPRRETWCPLHMRCADELAAGVVGPCMIWADDA